jgi:hypothetical protein
MRRWRKIVLVVVGVLAVLVIAGRILLGVYAPDIVRAALKKAVADNTALELSLGQVRVKGLADVALEDLKLTDPADGGRAVLSAKEIRATLAGLPWPGKDVRLSQVRVIQPRVELVREGPEGRLNIARLIVPKPAEPGGPKVIVEHLRIEGAALSFEDKLGKPQAPLGDSPAGAVPAPLVVELHDVDLALDLADEAALAYEAKIRIGDQSWGPAEFSGRVQAQPLRVTRVRSTSGAIRLTAENLSRLPGVPGNALGDYQPAAQVALQSLDYAAGMKWPRATATLSDAALTLPQVGRVSGAEFVAALDDQALTVELKKFPPLAAPVVGEVKDVTLKAALDLKTFALQVDPLGASLLGGRAEGKLTVADVRRWPVVPTGEFRLSGLRCESAELAYALAADGELRMVDNSAAAKCSELVIFLDAKVRGGHKQSPPLELPLSVVWQVPWPPQAQDLLAVTATLGNETGPVGVTAVTGFNHERRQVHGDFSGHVELAPELLRAVGGQAEEHVGQAAPRGRIRFEAKNWSIPVDDVLRSRGDLQLSADDFSVTIPGTERRERVAFDVTIPPPGQTPGDNLAAEVVLKLLDTGGQVKADLSTDKEARVLAAHLELSGLPLTDELLKSLAPLVSDAAKQPIHQLPRFKMTLAGTADLRYRREKEGPGGTLVPGAWEQIEVKDVALDWPAQQAKFSASAKLDAGANELALSGKLEGLRATSDLLATWRPVIAAAAPQADARLEQALQRVKRFEAVVAQADGQARLGLADGRLAGLTGSLRLRDVAADVAPRKDAELALSRGWADIYRTAEGLNGRLSINLMGGALYAALRQTADGVEFEAFTPRPGPTPGGVNQTHVEQTPARPLDLALAPQVILQSLKPLAGGKLDFSLTAKAKTLAALAESPVAFTADLSQGRFVFGEPGAARVVLASAGASGTYDPKSQTFGPTTVQPRDVMNAEGKYYLPAREVCRLTLAPLSVAEPKLVEADWVVDMTAGKLEGHLGYDVPSGELTIRHLAGQVRLGELPLAEMADELVAQLRPLEPQGEVALGGQLTLNTKAQSALDSATYDLTATTKNLTWLEPRAGEAPRGAAAGAAGQPLPREQPAAEAEPRPAARSKPLDATIAARRRSDADSHNIRFVTDDPDYGHLDARLGYSAGRVSVVVDRLDGFVLAPGLLRLAGPAAAALADCDPAGLFKGNPSLTLARDAQGRWNVVELAGALAGENVSLNHPSGDLPLRQGALQVALGPDKMVLKSLVGYLAEGTVKASGEIEPRGQWPMRGKLEISRLDVRGLKTIAGRPENELNGRLSIVVDEFAGPAMDWHKLTASGHATFGEGHLWQLPLFRALRGKLFEGAAAVLRNRFDPTSFRAAEADFIVKDGKIHFPRSTERKNEKENYTEAWIDSNLVRVVIDGDVFFDRRLDLHVASSLRADMGGAGGLGNLLPLLGKDAEKLRDLLKQLPGGELPILGSFYHVTGTFDEPVFNPDPDRTFDRLGGRALEFLKRKDEKPPPP